MQVLPMQMSPQGLVKIDAVKSLLARIETVPDAKVVRDKAEALREYAQQAGWGLEAQNTLAEIKIRAERKAGELLPNVIQQGGDPKTHRAVLADFGLDDHQSSSWQLEATVPEPVKGVTQSNGKPRLFF